MDTVTINPGEQNDISITVGGVVAQTSLSLPQTTIHEFYPSVLTATVSALDADGNLIATDQYVDASGNPITIALAADQSAGGTVAFKPSSISSPAPNGVAFTYSPATLTTTQQYDGFTTSLSATPSNDAKASALSLDVLSPVITEYPVTFNSGIQLITAIASGPDGQIWFAGATSTPELGSVSVSSRARVAGYSFSIPSGTTWAPAAMMFASDGTLWTASVNLFAQTTTQGSTSVYQIDSAALVNDVVAGPDGALWFTDQTGAIGRLPLGPSPSPTEFPVPAQSWAAASAPANIAVGSDGALWFTDNGNNAIGRITMAGQINEFPGAQDPWGIAQGPDGAIWFTERSPNVIGRMTTSGVITTYQLPTLNSGPTKMIAGPDGALWFTEGLGNRVGRVEMNGTITEFAAPNLLAQPKGLVIGPDNAIWFAECEWGNVDRLQ